MTAPLRLGIAGLGTVGIGVLETLAARSDRIARQAGRAVEVAAVCARDRHKQRGVDISTMRWQDDPVALASSPDVDVFVEMIGGQEGLVKEAVLAAISTGKDVVTANKALMAQHGQKIAELAEAKGCVVRFEAAVAGGIPVVKTLLESLAGNEITRVMGVMNGTCNYILTRMEQGGISFADAVAEARDLGYLEADPEMDIGGIDAAQKLALLTSIAFGTRVDFDSIDLQGIGRLDVADIRAAGGMGYRIKLLGVSCRVDNRVEQRMSPCMVPADSPLGQLAGGTNMVIVEGDPVGQIVLRGPGAGRGPTASAVVGDIIDIARGIRINTFGRPAASLVAARGDLGWLSPAPHCLRLLLHDSPGVLAKVARCLGDAGISIDRMRQYGHSAPEAVVLIVTHSCDPARLAAAMAAVSQLEVVGAEPIAIRIEQTQEQS